MAAPRAYKQIKKKAQVILSLFVLCGVFVIPAPSFAQDETENRLSRIENEIETLSRAIYKGEMPPPGALAASAQSQASNEVRLQQLEGEIQSLRGLIEEQNHKISQLTSKLDTTLSDVQMQIQDGQNTAPAYAPAPEAAYAPAPENDGVQSFTWSSNLAGNTEVRGTATAPPSETGLTTGQDSSMYDTAFSYLKNNNYDEAAKGFEAFLSAYPDHALVPNAKYWLGETYYVRGDFEKSARIFAEGYKDYPKGAKAPDNLLKLGMALAGAGNKNDACIAYAQLKTDFPTGATPVIRRAEQEMSKLGCES